MDQNAADSLVENARKAAMTALKAFNDPTCDYRVQQFLTMMVIAWNSLLQALMELYGIDYIEKDATGNVVLVGGREKSIDTCKMLDRINKDIIPEPVKENLKYCLSLRNTIAHSYLPEIDMPVYGYLQPLLSNFEELLTQKFGPNSALLEEMYAPLMVGFYQQTQTLDHIKSQIPLEVKHLLDEPNHGVSDEILNDNRYRIKIHLVPTTANRESSADMSVTFVPHDEVTDELSQQLLHSNVITKLKHVNVASDDLLLPSEVARQVNARIEPKFTVNAHTKCWKWYGVRPDNNGTAKPENTDDIYCVYDRIAKKYGYTSKWVDKLVNDMSNPEMYKSIVEQ